VAAVEEADVREVGLALLLSEEAVGDEPDAHADDVVVTGEVTGPVIDVQA